MYRFTVRHRELGKVRVVSGPTESIAREKALEVSKAWDLQFEKLLARKRLEAEKTSLKSVIERKAAQAEELTREAEKTLETLRTLLTADLVKEHQIDFEASKESSNYDIDSLQLRYNQREAAAIKEYCDAVMSNSTYPDFFPNTWEMQYADGTKTLIVEYKLPDVSRFPTTKEVKYVKTKDEFKETYERRSNEGHSSNYGRLRSRCVQLHQR